MALDTRINEKGSLKVSGDITPQPLALKLGVKADNVDLTALQPYIAKTSAMTLLSARLSSDMKVRYGAGKPDAEVTGDVSVAKLHTVDNALRDDFINWDRLDVLGVKFQHNPNRLEIAKIEARKPYARVIIEPDTTLNVKRVITGSKAPTERKTTAPAATPPKKTAHASKSRRVRPKFVPRVASNRESRMVSFPMAIKKIAVHDGQANFTDLSIKPTFSAGIEALEGTIVGLSSREDTRAKVDLHGQVDMYSPVSIVGEVNPFGAAVYTDLALSFRNIELTLFNPYSGKFAGYNITKGKLTTELHYKIDGGKLDAQHHVTIDQLEFGDKTASKDAVSLPVKLAVALLRDKNGVIDLNVPVNGTIDDPQFKVWPIIWKVLVNIVEKVVTAPFAWIGSMFGGGPDLQFIDFQPGTSELDAAGAEKVKNVSKALAERPDLKLDVPIAWIAELDRPALTEAQFLSQVHEAQAGMGGKKAAAQAPPAFDQMDPEAKLTLLTKLYEKSLGGAPKYPDSVTSIKSKPEAIDAKNDFLSQELRARIEVGDGDLKALGQQRAVAVQQALLAGTQIDPSRVFLVANDKSKNQDGKVRLELTLK
jgi:hypothetical protein